MTNGVRSCAVSWARSPDDDDEMEHILIDSNFFEVIGSSFCSIMFSKVIEFFNLFTQLLRLHLHLIHVL